MRTSVFILTLVMLAGCASRPPQIRLDQQQTADLSAYNVLWVLVEGSSQVATSHGLDVTLAELRREFIEQLNAQGKFAVREEPPTEGKAAQVKLTITTLRYVSGAGRAVSLLVPAASTRGMLGVDMTVTDPASAEVLWRLSASQMERAVPTTAVTSAQIADLAKEFAARLAAASKR